MSKQEKNKTPIGIIGGSGITSLPNFRLEKEHRIKTKFGATSDSILVGLYDGTRVAFLQRHGRHHTIPPHRVPYKANISALKSLGVKQILATCVVGSLKKNISPGTFVVPDQLIDLTWGRDDTFTQDKKILHLPFAKPYCNKLSKSYIDTLHKLKIKHLSKGCVVVIQGPRFSTIAESRLYASWGGDIINMTQYPEAYFAKELGICYSTIASVTDFNAGISDSISMVHMGSSKFDKVLKIFQKNIKTTLDVIKHAVKNVPECGCAETQIKLLI